VHYRNLSCAFYITTYKTVALQVHSFYIIYKINNLLIKPTKGTAQNTQHSKIIERNASFLQSFVMVDFSAKNGSCPFSGWLPLASEVTRFLYQGKPTN